MKKEYSYTTDEVPANNLAGTIEYTAKDDTLVIIINKKFMRINNYMQINSYNDTILPNKILSKIVTPSIQKDIDIERSALFNNANADFLGMDVTESSLFIYLGSKTEIKDEYKQSIISVMGSTYYFLGGAIEQTIDYTRFILLNTNNKESLFKFVRLYPEYKDDISKFIDLDNITKENEYRIESDIIKNKIELDISNSNKDNHIDEYDESNKFSRFLSKLMK